MNQLAFKFDVLNRMIGLTKDEREDVIQYISQVSRTSTHGKKGYRKKAIREIKMALQKN